MRSVVIVVTVCGMIVVTCPANAQFEDEIHAALEAQIRVEAARRTTARGAGSLDANPNDDADDSADAFTPLGLPNADDDDTGAPPAKRGGGGVVVWLPKPPPPVNVIDPAPVSPEQAFQDFLQGRAESRRRFEEFMASRLADYSHPVLDDIEDELGALNDRYQAGTITDDEFLTARGTLIDTLNQAQAIAHDPRLNSRQRDQLLLTFRRVGIEAAYQEVSERPYVGADYDEVPDGAFTGRVYIVQDASGPFSHAFALIQDPTKRAGWLLFEIGGPGFKSWEGLGTFFTPIPGSTLNFRVEERPFTGAFPTGNPAKDAGDFAVLFVEPHVQRRMLIDAHRMKQQSEDEDWGYHAWFWTSGIKKCDNVIREWLWRNGVHLPDNTYMGVDNPSLLPDAVRDYNNGYRSALEAGSWRNRAIDFLQGLTFNTTNLLWNPLSYYDETGDIRVQGTPRRPWVENPVLTPPELPQWVKDRTERLKNTPPRKTQKETPTDGETQTVPEPDASDLVTLPTDEVGLPAGADDFDDVFWSEFELKIVRKVMEEIGRQAREQRGTSEVPATPGDPILYDAQRDREVDDPIPYEPSGADIRQTPLDLLDPDDYGLLLPGPDDKPLALLPLGLPAADSETLKHELETTASQFILNDPVIEEDVIIRLPEWARGRRAQTLLDIAEDIEGEALLSFRLSQRSAVGVSECSSPIITRFGKPRPDDGPIQFDIEGYTKTSALEVTRTERGFTVRAGVAPNKKTVRLSATASEPFIRTTGTWGQPGRDQWALERIGMLDPAVANLIDSQRYTWKPCIVAVIDSGADITHPELRGQLWRNEGEIPFNNMDDDENGFVDDYYGYNTLDNSPNILDELGHGTHVAGIINATWDGKGIAGMSPECRLMIVKAFDDQGATDPIRLALAIRYAVLNGATIIHISAENNAPSEIEKAVVDWAIGKGVLVVAAAGSRARDAAGTSPAGLPGVLTVGASDRNDRRANFSGWGRHVDLVAPGTDILSLRASGTDFMFTLGGSALGVTKAERIVEDQWYRADGTSFAAPLVTGAAAALWTDQPDLTAEQIKNKLIMSCDDVEQPGWDLLTGAGRLNVARAVKADPDHLLSTAIHALRMQRGGWQRAILVTGNAAGTHFRQRQIQIAAGEKPAEKGWVTVLVSNDPVVNGQLGSIPARFVARRGTWTVRSVVEDTRGTVRESRMTFEAR